MVRITRVTPAQNPSTDRRIFLASSRLALRALSVPEQKDRRGEAVDEVASGDRAELPRGEESSDRDVAEGPAHGADVVVRLAEQPLTAAVARKEQRAGNGIETLCL